MIQIISPTGRGVRQSDSYGSGLFGASRKKVCPLCVNRSAPRPDCKECGGDGIIEYQHPGLDFVTIPPENTLAIFASELIRVGFPYAGDDRYRLVVLMSSQDPTYTAKLLYVKPKDTIPGETYEVGDVIGQSQDLRLRYPASERHPGGITPHVHLELRHKGAVIDPTPYLVGATPE